MRGRLEGWQIVYKEGGKFQIFGQLFDDSLEKFPDNTYFHTTDISTPVENVIAGNTVQSQNHEYFLGEQSSESGEFMLVNGVCVKGDEI